MSEKYKILIVEDEAIIAEDIQYCLEDAERYISVVANTGREALEKVPEFEPNLILMDIMLTEELDGIETAQAVLEKYDLPIIYLTSFTNKQMLERAKQTAPFGYIVKPFKNRELFATIDMAISKHQADLKKHAVDAAPSDPGHTASSSSDQFSKSASKSSADSMLAPTLLTRGIALQWEDWQGRVFHLFETISDQLTPEFRDHFLQLFDESEQLCQHLKLSTSTSQLAKYKFGLNEVLGFICRTFLKLHPTCSLHQEISPNLGDAPTDVSTLDQMLFHVLEYVFERLPPGQGMQLQARQDDSSEEGNGVLIQIGVVQENTSFVSDETIPLELQPVNEQLEKLNGALTTASLQEGGCNVCLHLPKPAVPPP